MTEVATTVEQYIAAWNEADPQRRRDLVASTFADDATYLDPHFSSTGIAEIDAMIAGVQEQFGGHRFKLLHGPDAHHDRVRFSWQMLPEAGGEPLAVGHDFATLADDGRLRDVTGFLET